MRWEDDVQWCVIHPDDWVDLAPLSEGGEVAVYQVTAPHQNSTPHSSSKDGIQHERVDQGLTNLYPSASIQASHAIEPLTPREVAIRWLTDFLSQNEWRYTQPSDYPMPDGLGFMGVSFYGIPYRQGCWASLQQWFPQSNMRGDLDKWSGVLWIDKELKRPYPFARKPESYMVRETDLGTASGVYLIYCLGCAQDVLKILAGEVLSTAPDEIFQTMMGTSRDGFTGAGVIVRHFKWSRPADGLRQVRPFTEKNWRRALDGGGQVIGFKLPMFQ